MKAPAIIWFRRDLRIDDNPALAAALADELPVIPLFVYAPDEEGDWAPGAASQWWLHHALASLAAELEGLGLGLLIRRGPTLACLEDLVESTGAEHVFWNRRYEPAVIERDRDIKQALREAGVDARSFNASLLWEPHEVENKSGDPFRVFTPFWKHVRTLGAKAPVPVDRDELSPAGDTPEGVSLESLGLRPEISWDDAFPDHWKPTLSGAREALAEFAEGGVDGYSNHRDLPAEDGTSRLSPFLAWGQLGPRQVWAAVHESGAAESEDGFKFLSEIAWREFAYHLLFHFPHTPERPLVEAYEGFPWEPDEEMLRSWQRGRTGYPIVDAGMRQLWAMGWMHNRVRMVVASLLVKHLLQPWQDGARWFWDTLVDADLASNTLGWQWSAGCGADAAPYFRIFNPMLQGEKFDADGDYVRQWVPELAKLPAKYIHQPWEAPDDVLAEAGVRLDDDYPRPIIEHRAGRQRALDALERNKQRRAEDD
ncbi:MAG: deoxyribodipyrimidine photo-lyase [Gammaproteobacteria bacterium]